MTDTPNRKRGRPSSKASDDLKPALLNAAVDLFARDGFDGVSLSQVAGSVGADVALIRYYFGSKADLWDASMRRLSEQFASDIARILKPNDGSATGALKAIIHAFVHTSAKWPQVSRVIVFDGDKNDARGDAIHNYFVAPFYAGLTDLIAKAVAEGCIADVSPRTVFFMITHGGSFPMALPALTNRFEGGDILSHDAIAAHADAIIALLIRET
ncbi:TetR/AcrR family transcriptional regulator [Shimia sp. Alg240-R146]|uniref:TetR/AcrR family transcriptional regulator n=1 Tax=Shimia sp. Alg240-R146 TaxID=2993449 RepID=UPI0022E63B76|nr:TetR/AcrR family transcriptional regulator [Shimia sp. Alg240-R146]